MIFIFLLISVFIFFSISFNSLTGHHKKFTLTDFHQEVVFIGKDVDHILDTKKS